MVPVLGMIAVLAPCAGAATYYVATNGSDSNPGTSAAPFLTLQTAANTAVAGDTVIVQDGTYGPGTAVTGGDSDPNNYSRVVLYHSGTPSASITFKAAHKWAAVLDCQMTCDSYINLLNASYIVTQDFVITHGYKEGIHSNDAAHHITLRGNRIESIAQRYSTYPYGMNGMYTNPNCHDFVIDGNEFHDIGRSNWTGLDHGLYLHGANFTITNNIFYNITDGWSIQAADGLSNVLIANNTFAGADGGGPGQIMLWNTQYNLTIENNIFYSPRNVAITRYASQISFCTISYNLVYGAPNMVSDATGCGVGYNLAGADPMFVNVASNDFHLQAGAPGINAGLYLGTVPADFDGVMRPLGVNTDLGAYESANLNSGLAARWAMNEGSGTYAFDSSGHSDNAALHKPVWWSSSYGITNWFSGSTSYGSVPEAASLEMTNQLTVAFWLDPNSTSNIDPRVISKLYDWEVKLNGPNRYPQFSAGGNYAMMNYSLPLNTWHHVVFTFSNGVVTGYVDGVPVPMAANTFGAAQTLPQWAYGLYLAADPSLSSFFCGSLDDIRIYNRALSPRDVAALYLSLPKQ